MSNVSIIRDHLLHELEHGVVSTQRLVGLITPEQWDYRPQENMRSLRELTHHLVMIPATDLAIIQEQDGSEFARIEGSIQDVTDPQQLCDSMQQSYEALKDYMVSLDKEDFLNKSTKAFYAEEGSVQVKWLIEVVTHVFHHRAQLFNYLKALGHDINMFILY